MAALIVTSGAAAQADTFAPTEAHADDLDNQGLIKGHGYVIIDTRTAESQVSERGTFYPTGEIEPDTLVIIREDDGSLPGGLDIAGVERMIEAEAAGDLMAIESEGFSVTTDAELAPISLDETVTPFGTGTFAAAPYSWSPEYSGTPIWANNENVRASYTFNVQFGTNQVATGRGLGYYVGYNGSEMGTWAEWYGLGVSTDGQAAGAIVPWGYIVATPKFKAYSSSIHAATGVWTSGGV